jgi:hypothetical protein
MTENFAECKNVHTIHQTPLCKVIPQAVRTVFFIQSGTVDVPLEICLKIMDIDVTTMIFDREEIVAFHIPVLELNPSPQSYFGFG